MMEIDDKIYKGRIVFDFDGVICVNNAWPYSDARPYHYAIEQINRAALEKWYIVICTARYMIRANGNQAEANRLGKAEAMMWLRKFGVIFNEVVLGKPSGVMYVDDRACRVESCKGLEDWNNNFWPELKRIESLYANL